MGSWDVSVFGNDQAREWLKQLLASDSPEPIFRALVGAAKLPESDFLQAPDCECAVAAAELVAAARGKPSSQVPAEALAWLSAREFVAGSEVADLAIRVIERVTSNSELKELWDDTDSASDWYATLRNIQKRLEEARPKTEPRKEVPQLEEEAYEQAAALVARGKFDPALDMYDHIISHEPSSQAAYMGRGICHLWLKHYGSAVADINKAQSLGKPILDAYQLRAQAAFHLGKYLNVVADISTFLRAKPQEWESYLIRALAYEQLEQLDNAVADLDAALPNLEPGLQREGYEHRARIYEKIGRADLAAADRNMVKQLQAQQG